MGLRKSSSSNSFSDREKVGRFGAFQTFFNWQFHTAGIFSLRLSGMLLGPSQAMPLKRE
jgi:hypothetical protein